MTALTLSGIIFVLTLSGIFLGTLLRRALPRYQTSALAHSFVGAAALCQKKLIGGELPMNVLGEIRDCCAAGFQSCLCPLWVLAVSKRLLSRRV
jgi:hypothetical protein